MPRAAVDRDVEAVEVARRPRHSLGEVALAREVRVVVRGVAHRPLVVLVGIPIFVVAGGGPHHQAGDVVGAGGVLQLAPAPAVALGVVGGGGLAPLGLGGRVLGVTPREQVVGPDAVDEPRRGPLLTVGLVGAAEVGIGSPAGDVPRHHEHGVAGSGGHVGGMGTQDGHDHHQGRENGAEAYEQVRPSRPPLTRPGPVGHFVTSAKHVVPPRNSNDSQGSHQTWDRDSASSGVAAGNHGSPPARSI